MNLDQLIWEGCNCSWCGSKEFDLLFRGPDRLEGLPGTFQMVICSQCGLLRQNPRLKWESLKHFYPDEYASYSYVLTEGIQENPIRYFIRQYGNWKKRRAIERYQSGGRLLEVGCGTGEFLEELLRTKNWEIVAIEPNENAATYVKSKFSVPIFQSHFDDIDFENGSFDVIVMWYVLEHLPQPISDLRLAYKLLRTNGWLVFSIPNVDSWEAKVFGKYWAGWDLPRHLYLFPRPLLHEILESIGFQVVSEGCISTSYAILGHCIDFWSQTWEHKYPKTKQILIRIYNSWFVRAVLILPLAILDQLKLSTTITLFARKVDTQD